MENIKYLYIHTKEGEIESMSIIAKGRVFEFAIFAALVVLVLYYLWSVIYRKKEYPLRRMPQVDAISEGVDRAVEMGKPIFILPGNGVLATNEGVMTIAGLNVLRYTTRLAVRRGAIPILCSPGPQVQPLMDGIFREVCAAEGKPEAYRRENVRFTPNAEAMVSQDMIREGVACFVNVGGNSGGQNGLGWARDLGALTIGGTGRYVHLATWAVWSHYPMFLEDMYAVSTICAQDNVVGGSMYAGDLVKLGMLALTWVAFILILAGQPVLEWFKL